MGEVSDDWNANICQLLMILKTWLRLPGEDSVLHGVGLPDVDVLRPGAVVDVGDERRP